MKNIKRAVALILAVLLTVSVLFVAIPYIASAAETSTEIRDKISELEKDAKELEDKRDKLNAEIEATKNQSLTTIQKKTQLDQQIEISQLEIQNLNDQIREYNLLLADTQAKLDAGLAQQEELNQKYKARVRAMEENGSISYWSILFKARSISDLIDRIAMIGEIAAADKKMMKQMQESNAAVAALMAEVEADRAKLQTKSGELEKKNAQLLTQRADADKLLKDLVNQANTLEGSYKILEEEEDRIRKMIMEEQARYEKVLEEEKRKALEEANKNNAAGTGTTNPVFSSPLPKGSARVTDAYGYRIHPIYGYYAMHHGVDLAANHGTPVYAIAAGYVTIASYTSANGNYVSLAHGNGYGSIYCHLDRYTVKVGDFVVEGEIIGYVGSTGWATGPHLHFEIHKDGTSVNPMQYISIK